MHALMQNSGQGFGAVISGDPRRAPSDIERSPSAFESGIAVPRAVPRPTDSHYKCAAPVREPGSGDNPGVQAILGWHAFFRGIMKQTLQLRLGQQLALTPQLQQAIRMLQLNALELAVEMREALQNNPLLEDAREAGADEPAEPETAEPEVEQIPPTDEIVPAVDDLRELNDADFSDSALGPSGSSVGGDDDFARDQSPELRSLRQHLEQQLDVLKLRTPLDILCMAVIDALDADGFLRCPAEDLLAAVPQGQRADAEDVEQAIALVQQLDPSGVAARSVGECLQLQLQVLPPSCARTVALQLVEEPLLTYLGRGDRQRLLQGAECSESELDRAVSLIRSLNPRPGAEFAEGEIQYVMPDVRVRRIGGRWRALLNQDGLPRLRVNRYYAGLASKASRADGQYLKGQLQEARWLIRSLETRHETLLKVAETIVEQQQAFFEHGPEAMRPLVLRDIAEAIGMHESTISRVTSHKLMDTPRGLLEFRYFFCSHVGTSDGGEASAVAIHAKLRKLVDAENPSRPWSDAALAKQLQADGIEVARRTVAKYREQLRIPASSDRRRLA